MQGMTQLRRTEVVRTARQVPRAILGPASFLVLFAELLCTLQRSVVEFFKEIQRNRLTLTSGLGTGKWVTFFTVYLTGGSYLSWSLRTCISSENQ
jgi:hypothetical protein